MCTIHVVQDQKDVSKETTRRNSPEIRRLQGDKSDIKLYRWENRVYAGRARAGSVWSACKSFRYGSEQEKRKRG
jgi:hypothetical protein